MPFSSGVKVQRASDPFPADSGEARQDSGGRIAAVCLQGFNYFPRRRPEGSRTPPSPPSSVLQPGVVTQHHTGTRAGGSGQPLPWGTLQIPAREGTKQQNIHGPAQIFELFLFILIRIVIVILINSDSYFYSLFLSLICLENTGRNVTTV